MVDSLTSFLELRSVGKTLETGTAPLAGSPISLTEHG